MRESILWEWAKLRGVEPTSHISSRRIPGVRIRLPQLATNATLPTLPIPEDYLRGNPIVGDRALYPEHLSWMGISADGALVAGILSFGSAHSLDLCSSPRPIITCTPR